MSERLEKQSHPRSTPPAARQNLLIVRLRSIGDMVLTTAVLEQIHNKYPDLSVHYIAEDGIGDVLKNNPHIDSLLLLKKDLKSQFVLILKLLFTSYYMAINLHGGPRSILLTMLSGARKRAGKITGSPLCRFYTHVTKHPREIHGYDRKYHSLERTMSAFEQVGFMVGEVSSWRQHLFPGETDRNRAHDLLKKYAVDRYVVMHAVVRGPNEWGIANKRSLAQKLHTHCGCKTLLLGEAGDRMYLKDLAKGIPEMVVIAGEAHLLESAALIEASVGFVGLDSGPAHMAAALDKPIAVLFGTTYSYLWRPWGQTVQVFEHKRPNGEKYDSNDPTHGLISISVDAVFEWLSKNIEKVRK